MGNVRVTDDVLAAARDIVGIVRHIVDHPDRVNVQVRTGTYRVAVELFTDPDDVSQVVGRNGHIATSLRSFLSALAGKHKIKIDFDYVTEEDNRRAAKERERTNRPPPIPIDKHAETA